MWIDTYVLAARGLFGALKNKKLDTLAEVHLGMHKNDVSYKDMFVVFYLTRIFELLSGKTDDASMAKRNDIITRINALYLIMVNKHNKDMPRGDASINNITINHLNELIATINMMNQRGEKMKVYQQRDASKMNMREMYGTLREKCIQSIESWNIPMEEHLEPYEKLKVMWWLIVMYCLQDTRIPYQLITQQNIVQVLCE